MLKYILAGAFAVATTSASAAVLTATGNGAIFGDSTGVDLREDRRESADITAYDEAQSVGLTAGQLIADYVVGSNLSVGDTVAGNSSLGANEGAAIGAGRYASHLLQFDPDGSLGGRNATFTFSGNIVALIVSNSGTSQLLNASDAVFGVASNFYTSSARRVEGSESMTLLSANTLVLNGWAANDPYTDEIRVITEPAPVPLPASLPLLALGVAGVAALGRRKAL